VVGGTSGNFSLLCGTCSVLLGGTSQQKMALAKNMPVPYLSGISQQLINSWSVGRNKWSFFSLLWNLFHAFGRSQSTNNMIKKKL